MNETTRHRFEVEITDDLMHVLDDDNCGHDAHILVDRDAARRRIESWSREYDIDVADANQQIDNYFADRDRV